MRVNHSLLVYVTWPNCTHVHNTTINVAELLQAEQPRAVCRVIEGKALGFVSSSPGRCRVRLLGILTVDA